MTHSRLAILMTSLVNVNDQLEDAEEHRSEQLAELSYLESGDPWREEVWDKYHAIVDPLKRRQDFLERRIAQYYPVKQLIPQWYEPQEPFDFGGSIPF